MLGLASLACLGLLVLVHVVTPGLRFLNGTPRSIWLSLAGGVSVAYVFVHFMPELAASQEKVAEAVGGEGTLIPAERHVFLIALAELLTFYGLHRLAQTSRSKRADEQVNGGRGTDTGAATSSWVFWLHMASFAAAMALHFVVTDYGFYQDHKAPYRQIGRWILAAAVIGGWLLGLVTDVHEAAIATLTVFLGGGVVLNVLKEEVPSERQSRFWAFAAGAAGYAVLLLML